jgi:glycosyltransferase involved in cell wall biosynthesis
VLRSGFQFEETVRSAGVEVSELRRGAKWNLWSAWRAIKRIARAKTDLIHVYLPTVAIYASLAKLIYRFPQPMVMRCGWSNDPGPLVRWRYGRLYRSTFTAFLANSPSAAAFLESVGVEPERIRLLPNGHDLEAYRQPVDRQEVRRSLGVEADAQLIVYVGRLMPEKRVEDLIDALALIVPHWPDIRAIVVGSGSEFPRLVQRIDERKLNSHVKLLGERDDIPSLLKSSDLFVFPSECEGSPNSVIEACLAGVPIVACDVPGVRDVVQHESTALLATTHNPQSLAANIERALGDRQAAQQRAAAAREQAESLYNINDVIARLSDLYDELLDRNSSEDNRESNQQPGRIEGRSLDPTAR